MAEFSPQLDMLIEKPSFGGKVHFWADGKTMAGVGTGQRQPRLRLNGSSLCFLSARWSLRAV